MQFQVIWQDRKRQPAVPFNRAYPWGKSCDLAGGMLPACQLDLEWPALRCGQYLIACIKCGMRVVVTTAGRVDDPRQVRMPCKVR